MEWTLISPVTIKLYSSIWRSRWLYVDESKFSDEIKANLAKDNVVIKPYNQIYEDIKGFKSEDVVLVDPARLNFAIFSNIPEVLN